MYNLEKKTLMEKVYQCLQNSKKSKKESRIKQSRTKPRAAQITNNNIYQYKYSHKHKPIFKVGKNLVSYSSDIQ